MPRRTWRLALQRQRPPLPRPLLAPAFRPFAAALLAVCLAVIVLFGVWFAHQTRPGRLDAAVNLRSMPAWADIGEYSTSWPGSVARSW